MAAETKEAAMAASLEAEVAVMPEAKVAARRRSQVATRRRQCGTGSQGKAATVAWRQRATAAVHAAEEGMAVMVSGGEGIEDDGGGRVGGSAEGGVLVFGSSPRCFHSSSLATFEFTTRA